MAITFQFWAPDPKLRGALTVESVDAAVAHVCDVLNGPDVPEGRKWTIDEEGDLVPGADWLLSQLQYRSKVRLYDQNSIGTLETLEICIS